MTVVYDAGVLIAADRGEAMTRARHTALLRSGSRPVVPSPVVWQVWRNGARQARLSWLLRGCLVEPLDGALARSAGEVLGRAGTSDGVDAVVVLVGARVGGPVYTSDLDDLKHLRNHLPGAADLVILQA